MAEMDIGRGIFECGQTYVALSRVKNLDGLYLSNFEPNKIKTNKKVKQFYQEIPEVEYEVEVEIEEEDEILILNNEANTNEQWTMILNFQKQSNTKKKTHNNEEEETQNNKQKTKIDTYTSSNHKQKWIR